MYRNIVPASLLFSFLGLSAAPAYANWTVYKFFDAGVTATDNLQLFLDEEIVSSVKPSVELSFDGNRFDSEIIAEVEVYNFSERGDTIVDPRVSINTTGALIDNVVFLETGLEIGKIITGGDFFDLTEDSDTQTRFRFNPFFSRQLGQATNLFLGYGHQSLDDESDGTVDFLQNTLVFALNKDPTFGGLIWGVGGNFESLRLNDQDLEQNFDSGSIFGSLGYTTSQTTLFEVIAGQEVNDFTDINNDGDANAFLAARLHWNPSERTSLIVGFSDRFFGEGPTLSFSHQVRNSIFTAQWTREVSNADVTLNSVTPFSADDPQIPTNIEIGTDGNATAQLLFVDERFNVGYKLAGRRTDLIIDGILSDQTEIGGDASRTQFIGRVAFDRHLSSLTTLRLQYEHLAEETITDETENENRIGFRLIYNFDRKERASIINDDS